MDAVVLRADARRLPLPDGCVDLIVTSPPYFGLRSYTDGGAHYAGQIGSEATPAEWLAALVECTREWVRVLKPGGSLFVNLGDKYAGNHQNGYERATLASLQGDEKWHARVPVPVTADGARPKSLLGLPWRYALAVSDQLGLILRRDIIWAKPNGLPESVTDRCRSSHEYVFHLVRSPRYFSAVDEIREPTQDRGGLTYEQRKAGLGRLYGPGFHHTSGGNGMADHPLGKLPGSVWSIPSQALIVPPALGVDHFAAFPMELPRRIILGWSPGGVCTGCGQGRRPVTDADAAPFRPERSMRTWHGDGADPRRTLGTPAAERNRRIVSYACGCGIGDHQYFPPTRPAVVLDPFGGTGTTALVAHALGRHAITADLSADYCRLAAWRLSDPGERARALEVPKPPPVPEDQAALF